MAVQEKRCASCKESRPASDFYPDRAKASGLSSWCKPCTKARQRTWYLTDAGQQSVAAAAARRDRSLEAQKDRERRARDPEKYRAKSRAWEAAHRDEINERHRKWRQREYAKDPSRWIEKSARRRARLKGLPVVDVIDRMAIYERDGGRCHICGKKVSRQDFTLDHLIPVAWGERSEHSARNLRVAHKACNSRMSDGRLPAQLLLIG